MQKRNWPLILFVLFIFFISTGLFLTGVSMIFLAGDMEPQRGDIAVVKLEGEIFESSKLIRRLEKLSERDDLQAVVLRIDSPGGLVSASQEIYRAVIRLKEKKKVVASMGTFGTSGAYYVSCGADKILANEGTITGSIGVKISHVNFGELVTLARVRPNVLTTGRYKDMGSPLRDLRPDEQQLFQEMISEMHRQFKQVVAKERKLEIGKVDQIADGRVYTGQQALKLGLIDEIGSLQDAIDVAAKLAGIEGKPQVFYPKDEIEHWIRYFLRESMTAVFGALSEFQSQAQTQTLVLWRI